MNTPNMRTSVSDEAATAALRNFFVLVYELDGPGELVRMYESFYRKTYKAYPPSRVHG